MRSSHASSYRSSGGGYGMGGNSAMSRKSSEGWSSDGFGADSYLDPPPSYSRGSFSQDPYDFDLVSGEVTFC
jgi:hypothetical protein